MAPKHGFTEEELELLTDEEREGLLDEDMVDDGDDDEEETGTENTEPDGGAGAKAADEDQADSSAAKPDAESAPEGQKPGEEAEPPKAENESEKPDQETPPVAQYAQPPMWQAPPDAKERLEEIEKKKDELHQLFDDGEITSQELRARLKPIDADYDKLKDTLLRAQFSQEWAKENYIKQTVPAFLAQHEEYKPGNPLFIALDAEVKKLQAESSNPFDPQILQKAHATVRESTLKALGIDPKTIDAKKGGKAPAGKHSREVPPSLRDLPSADANEMGAGKFAYLDRLEGVEYERALAKLTDAERDQYMQDG